MTQPAESEQYIALKQEFNKLLDALVKLEGDFELKAFNKRNEILADYYLKVGKVKLELLYLQKEVFLKKRELEMLISFLSKGLTINKSTIRELLEKEALETEEEIKRTIREMDKALGYSHAKTLSVEQSQKLKENYRILAKKLHPDAGGVQSPQRKAWWSQALLAYKSGDHEGLEVLMLIVSKEETPMEFVPSKSNELELQNAMLTKRITDLMMKMEALNKEFPFDLEAKLADPAWVKKENEDGSLRMFVLMTERDRFESAIKNLNISYEDGD